MVCDSATEVYSNRAISFGSVVGTGSGPAGKDSPGLERDGGGSERIRRTTKHMDERVSLRREKGIVRQGKGHAYTGRRRRRCHFPHGARLGNRGNG